jgi:ABC-2 type transport system ATP-binding protein
MSTLGLVCSGCTKAYGRSLALDAVSLQVTSGQVVGLVGPNGAGKTTLLHAVVGLVRLDHGSVRINGLSSGSPAAKRHLAFMADDLPRPEHLTGREYVGLVSTLYGRRPDPEVMLDLADRLEVLGRLDDLLASLSHGMRRKVDLLAAVAVEPDVLLMDEPFSGLDPTMVDVVGDVVRQRRDAGLATLLSAHDLELAAELADRIVMLDHGRVVVEDTPAGILARCDTTDIRAAFRTLRSSS